MNVNYKRDLKALSTRLKNVLPSLVSSEQTAYVKDIFIGETGTLISGIIEVTDLRKMEELLAKMNIEKYFDSLDRFFLMFFLKNGFGESFMPWIETVTKN